MQEVGDSLPVGVDLLNIHPMTVDDVIRQQADGRLLNLERFRQLRRVVSKLDDGSEVARLTLGPLRLSDNLIFSRNDRRVTPEDNVQSAITQQCLVHALGYLGLAPESNKAETLAKVMYDVIRMNEYVIRISVGVETTLGEFWRGMRKHAAVVTAMDEVYLPAPTEVRQINVDGKIDGVGVINHGRGDPSIFLFDTKLDIKQRFDIDSIEVGGSDRLVSSLPNSVKILLGKDRLDYKGDRIKHLVISVPDIALSQLTGMEGRQEKFPYLFVVNRYTRLTDDGQKQLRAKVEAMC